MTRKEEIMNEIAILKHENSRIEGAMDVANEVGAIMAVLDLCETLVENEKKIELLEEEISLIDIWRTFVKHKVLFWTIFVIVLLVLRFYAKSDQDIYTSILSDYAVKMEQDRILQDKKDLMFKQSIAQMIDERLSTIIEKEDSNQITIISKIDQLEDDVEKIQEGYEKDIPNISTVSDSSLWIWLQQRYKD